MIESPSYEDAAALCKKILQSFSDGEIGEIYLAYTHFKKIPSAMSRSLSNCFRLRLRQGRSGGYRFEYSYEL